MRTSRAMSKHICLIAQYLIVLGLLSFCSSELGADEVSSTFSTSDLKFFESRVRPILVKNCLKCHGGGESIKGGLRLTSRSRLVHGGDTGPAVSLDDPAESLLLQAINYESYEMPPSGKLPQRDIDILTQWVHRGLPWTPQDGTQEQPAVGGLDPPAPGPRSGGFTWRVSKCDRRPRTPTTRGSRIGAGSTG